MKTKIISIIILTLTVIVGGGMLYSDMLRKTPFVGNTDEDGKVILSAPRVNDAFADQAIFGKKLPNYSSAKSKYSKRTATNYSNSDILTTNVVKPNMKSTGSAFLPAPPQVAMVKKETKTGIYNTETLLIAQYSINGRSSKRMIAETATASAGSLGALTAPMMAGAAGLMEHGLSGDPNEPSDDFLPPEGTPLSDAVPFMLIISLFYGIIQGYVRKKG